MKTETWDCYADPLKPLRWRKPRLVKVKGDVFQRHVAEQAEIFEVTASATAACGKFGGHIHDEECWTGERHQFIFHTHLLPDVVATKLDDLRWYVGEYLLGEWSLKYDMSLENVRIEFIK